MKLPVEYNVLTPKERKLVREQYIKEQNSKCFYCSCDLYEKPPKNITDKAINLKLFPKNFLDHPIHLQHDHVSGFTEGAVHAYCNAIMWQYENR